MTRPTAACAPGGAQPPWLSVEEFLYVPLDRGQAQLRLTGRRPEAVTGPVWASLVVSRGRQATLYAARPELSHERHHEGAGHGFAVPRRVPDALPLLWRVTFEVPLHIVEAPEALFSLMTDRYAVVALPTPRLHALRAPTVARRRRPSLPRQAGRHAAALVAGFATAAALSVGGIAAADTTPSAPATTGVTTGTTAADVSPPTASTTTGTTTPATPPPTTTTTTTATTPPPTTTTTTTAITPPPTVPTTTTTPPPTVPTTTTPPPPTPVPTTTTVTTAPSTSTPASSPVTSGTPSPFGTPRAQRGRSRRAAGPHRPRKRIGARTKRALAKAHPSPTPAPRVTLASPAADALPLNPFTAAQIAHFESIGAGLDQPPAFLIPIYKAAGERYHVPWQILASINAIETDYGRNLAVSPAGAIGWMQFEPGTWAEYGISADRAGRPNPYDPRDAIFSAARYLAINGAPAHMREALYSYNHALWYVDAVLWRAQLISDKSTSQLGPTLGYALPLDASYMTAFGRTDDGVDIETAPDGAAVYSITPGVVTAIASDPGGFGPNYPVILVTAGPLAGQYIYYGHVAASLVTVGQHVLAGQPIAVMGHTGDAASLGHGHIEIGFSDSGGDPLNHHGASAWTPSGEAMRHVLDTLLAAPRH